MKEKISELSERFFDEVRSMRREIHKNPELSFEEYKTSAYVKGQLKKMGIPFQDGFVKTGIVADIKGEMGEGRVVALRADMDALPIQEMGEHEYKSVNNNVMHACGHDIHTSSLLGVAKILNTLKSEFRGTVRLIFQPGEEKLPGGAKLMMDEGALADNPPDVIIGQHVQPDMEAGTVGFRPGMYMASADEIYLTVKGKGGHAAMPHQLVDTVLMTSHIIVALQQLVSRNANSAVPTVLSFGKVVADGATNVIPQEARVEGTFRTMNENWRDIAHGRIREIAQGVASSMGGECVVEIKKGYPFLVNHQETTMFAAGKATDLLGKENVASLDLRMTAEDFSYFSQMYPSVFYRLGIQSPGKEPTSLHSPFFFADEDALKTGMKTMAYIAYEYLNNEKY